MFRESKIAYNSAQSVTDILDHELCQKSNINISLLNQTLLIKWEKSAKLTASDQDVLFQMKNTWSEKKKTRTAAEIYWHCK